MKLQGRLFADVVAGGGRQRRAQIDDLGAAVRSSMTRVNLSIPVELLEHVREQAPGLNLSAVLRDALAAKLGCTHDELTCCECATVVDRREMIDAALCRFYSDVQWEHSHAIGAGGTLDGFGTVLKRVAQSYGVSNVDRVPLARSTRAQREARLDAKLAELPVELDRARIA